MKNLYESLKESLLDVDQDHDAYILAEAWSKKNLKNISHEISKDGVINILDVWAAITIRNDDVPKGVIFTNIPHLRLENCSNLDMSIFKSIKLSIECLYCDFKKFINVADVDTEYWDHSIKLFNCTGSNLKWLPITTTPRYSISIVGEGDFDLTDYNNISYLEIRNDIGKLNLGTVTKLDIDIRTSKSFFKDLKVDNCQELYIQRCDQLEDLTGIPENIKHLYINSCHKLKSLKGLEKTKLVNLSFSDCPNLNNSDYLPKSLCFINAHGSHACWITDEIKAKYPSIYNVKGINLYQVDPTLGGKLKPGLYGAVRSAAKSHSLAWGSSRGALVLDRVKKIGGKTVVWEKCKSRQFEDFELMDDNANSKKDWSYIDKNGFNDCTGVGIEVGDEVVVYCASGSFGKSNGVERDVVLGFTPKMVKTKNNGNRPAGDICILRPHKIAENFFK